VKVGQMRIDARERAVAAECLRRREKVKAVYPGEKWARRVDAMSDHQVIAIFMRLRGEGKL